MMILPTGAIHLLDRLKFRFREDHGIDARLTEELMTSATSLESVGHVLSWLESSLAAKNLFWWVKTAEDRFRLMTTSKGSDDPKSELPEPFRRILNRHWIRFEPISADWQDSIRRLYGNAQNDVGAIDVWSEESHVLLVVWGETPPNHAPDDPALSLLDAAAALDDVPPSLKKSVRALNGRTYYLPALLALHRMHDVQSTIRQNNAIRIAWEWLTDVDEREAVVAMIRIQQVGTILAPRFVLEKSKRSKAEIELIDETIEGTPDLLEVFTLPSPLMQAMRWENSPQTSSLSFIASIALAAWRCADAKASAHPKKVNGPLAKRLDVKAKALLKTLHRI